MKGLGAQGLGQVVTLFVQIVSVPLYIHYWGKLVYGEWLLLSTVPGYLGLSDLGFASAASNEMTMRVARGDRDGALRVFQSTWVLITAMSAAVIGVVALLVTFMPIKQWLKLTTLPHWEIVTVIVVLLAQVLFALQRGVLSAAYRCDGNFAYGTLLGNLMRLSEFLISVLVVWRGGGLICLAVVTLVARVIENGLMSLDLHRRSPWLKRGFGYANMETIKELRSPAFAFMGFPIGNALSLQGMLTVIGITMNPAAVVLFSTSRTLTRAVWQILYSIGNAVWVELSTAMGRGDLALARRLHRRACQAALGLAVAASAFLYAAGPKIYHLWTKGAVHFDPVLFHILLLVVICNSLWSTSYVVLIAVNKHQTLAAVFVAATAASLAMGYCLIRVDGLHGAAWALLLIDLFMTLYVVNKSLALLDDTLGDYTRSLVRLPGRLAQQFR